MRQKFIKRIKIISTNTDVVIGYRMLVVHRIRPVLDFMHPRCIFVANPLAPVFHNSTLLYNIAGGKFVNVPRYNREASFGDQLGICRGANMDT